MYRIWSGSKGLDGRFELTDASGIRRTEAMARHRTHSIAFKCRIVQECLAGETLHGLARRRAGLKTLFRTDSRNFSLSSVGSAIGRFMRWLPSPSCSRRLISDGIGPPYF